VATLLIHYVLLLYVEASPVVYEAICAKIMTTVSNSATQLLSQKPVHFWLFSAHLWQATDSVFDGRFSSMFESSGLCRCLGNWV